MEMGVEMRMGMEVEKGMEMEMVTEMFYAHNLLCSTLSSEQTSPCPASMSYCDPSVRNPSPPLRSVPGLRGNLLPQQCPEMFPDPTVSRGGIVLMPELSGCCNTSLFQEVAPRTPNVETQRNLVPVPGKDPITGKCWDVVLAGMG